MKSSRIGQRRDIIQGQLAAIFAEMEKQIEKRWGVSASSSAMATDIRSPTCISRMSRDADSAAKMLTRDEANVRAITRAPYVQCQSRQCLCRGIHRH
jgi:hypothetical protein